VTEKKRQTGETPRYRKKNGAREPYVICRLGIRERGGIGRNYHLKHAIQNTQNAKLRGKRRGKPRAKAQK